MMDEYGVRKDMMLVWKRSVVRERIRRVKQGRIQFTYKCMWWYRRKRNTSAVSTPDEITVLAPMLALH